MKKTRAALSRVLLALLALWLGGSPGPARAQAPASAPYNSLILQQIRAMPTLGGYSASHLATQRLGAAVLPGEPLGLNVQAAQAQPSYCSGATYLVFLKTLDALARGGKLPADEGAFRSLLISGQRDGEGVWGRWNANGPGTARLFHEAGLGINFADFNEAQPGDFMKIWWSQAVGRREHGHSVIYLGSERINGVDSVRFWSSNTGVGYGEKTVPRAKISAAVFSRLTAPGNIARAPGLSPKLDPYLAGLLTSDSSQAEVRQKCGM